jgi:hypothetical protein
MSEAFNVLTESFCSNYNYGYNSWVPIFTPAGLTFYIIFNILNFFLMGFAVYMLWLPPFGQGCCVRGSRKLLGIFDIRTHYKYKRVAADEQKFVADGEKSALGGLVTLYALFILLGAIMYTSQNTSPQSGIQTSQNEATILNTHSSFNFAAAIKFQLDSSTTTSCSLIATNIDFQVTSSNPTTIKNLSAVKAKQFFTPTCIIYREWQMDSSDLNDITVTANGLKDTSSNYFGIVSVVSDISTQRTSSQFVAKKTLSVIKSKSIFCGSFYANQANTVTVPAIAKSFEYGTPRVEASQPSFLNVVDYPQNYKQWNTQIGSNMITATIQFKGQKVLSIEENSSLSQFFAYILYIAVTFAIIPWIRNTLFVIVTYYQQSAKNRLLVLGGVLLIMTSAYSVMGYLLSMSSLFSGPYISCFTFTYIIHTSLIFFTLAIHSCIYHISYKRHQEAVEIAETKDETQSLVYPQFNPNYTTDPGNNLQQPQLQPQPQQQPQFVQYYQQPAQQDSQFQQRTMYQ